MSLALLRTYDCGYPQRLTTHLGEFGCSFAFDLCHQDATLS
jgi:hypothetical protein